MAKLKSQDLGGSQQTCRAQKTRQDVQEYLFIGKDSSDIDFQWRFTGATIWWNRFKVVFFINSDHNAISVPISPKIFL